MNADIRKIDGLKLYFPYLDSKQGRVCSLRSQISWITLYSLFVDKIIFPPRSLFSGQFALQNLADLHSIPLLRSLVESGTLITTTTDNNVRDLPDLFERYSGLAAIPPYKFGSDFQFFSRDELFQRSVVSNYMFEKIRKAEYLESHEKISMAKLLATQPDHIQLIAAIQGMFFEHGSVASHELQQEAVVGYFLGGAKGNSAIMPPQHEENDYSFFDFFYSKSALLPFGNQLIKKLAKPLHQLSAQELRKIKTNLAVFRYKYNELSIKHRELFHEVLNTVSKSHPTFRLRAPIAALQATVAITIGLALSPIFGAAAFGLAIATKWLWESISKGYKLNDKAVDQVRIYLTRTKLLKPYHKDLLELLDLFESSLSSAIMR